jgi:riboflavin kinase/FMN adenylyltransferase
MRVYRDFTTLPLFKKAVITIGTFDGVHSGHQQVIAQLKEAAARINGETVIITFDPHPRKIISPAPAPGEIQLLTTLSEKIGLLDKAGIDHLVIVTFNQAFAAQSAEEYIKDFLYQYFRPQTIIIGYDHRFGKGRTGDYHLMDHYGEILGFSVKEIPAQVVNEVTVSSTRIRNALLDSDITTANDLLGYDYFFEGTVIRGNQLGRTIGYPTANLRIENEEKLVPGNGVYAVKVVSLSHKKVNQENQVTATHDLLQHNTPGTAESASETVLSATSGVPSASEAVLSTAGIPSAANLIRYTGMMNIGLRPTIDGKTRTIEVNIFDFNEDIYGDTLRIFVKRHIRSEVKFNGLDELKQQLRWDKEEVLRVLKTPI